MRTVLEERRWLEEPTHEEFVDAVFRAHERIQSMLQALARDGGPREDGWTVGEAETIRSYCEYYGVDVGRIAPAGMRSRPGVRPSSTIKSQMAL